MRSAAVTALSHQGRFMVGRDARGNWIVSDSLGLTGGVFTDRQAAVHFAMMECDYAPGEVCAAPAGLVLSLDAVFAGPVREQ
ncbi:hypothetical protein ASC89_25870 [Devosia sp. Root413D1]|uniref:hypothetical protein n=1 Tax=Devosia sp. Root413D1 TaxID=1736531 RepID=UPI0006F629E8|nr:hypothetical protein [Devosia sp. Root413D1]KQW75026.1 hypothetical protein ASC89_25870 [Devosia sp. Root413D1]